MYGVLLFIYLLLVLLMIGTILIQQPKGGGLSGTFGGGSMETLLGVRGAPTFFQKLTAILGGVFLFLSLILSLLHAPRYGTKSAIEKELKRGTLNLPTFPQGEETPK